MEQRLNLMQLSIQDIIKKIRSYKSDESINTLSLFIKRKQTSKSFGFASPKNGRPSNVQNRIQKKNISKNGINLQNHSSQFNDSNSILTNSTLRISQQNHQKYQQNQQQLINTQNTHFLTQNNITKQNQQSNLSTNQKMQNSQKYYSSGNYQKAIHILIELLDEIQLGLNKWSQINPIQKNQNISLITFHLANCYYRKKDYNQAIRYYNMEFIQENLKYKAMRKSNLGAIFLHLKKYQESLKNYTHSLKIYSNCEKQNVDLSNIYHNVGIIYFKQNMYQISSKYFQMAIQQRQNKSPHLESPLFSSILKFGISLKFQTKYQQSLKVLFYASGFLDRNIGSPIEIYKEIAQVNEHLQRSHDALNYYQKICDSEKANESQKAQAYQKVGLIFLKEKNQNQGFKYLKIAQNLYEKMKNQRKLSTLRKRFR